MNSATITSAKYCVDLLGNNSGVVCVFNGQDLIVPLDPANSDYAEIMRQVEAGELTIQDADD
jgi:hypothetical protein